MRRYWSGGMPSSSWIAALTLPMVLLGSSSRVMVLPVSLFTKICTPPRRRRTKFVIRWFFLTVVVAERPAIVQIFVKYTCNISLKFSLALNTLYFSLKRRDKKAKIFVYAFAEPKKVNFCTARRKRINLLKCLWFCPHLEKFLRAPLAVESTIANVEFSVQACRYIGSWFIFICFNF